MPLSGNPAPGDEFKELLFTQRDATFYGAELLVEYDVAPIWAGVWGVEGSTTSCARSSMTATMSRVCPRTGSAAASTTTMPPGSPA